MLENLVIGEPKATYDKSPSKDKMSFDVWMSQRKTHLPKLFNGRISATAYSTFYPDIEASLGKKKTFIKRSDKNNPRYIWNIDQREFVNRVRQNIKDGYTSFTLDDTKEETKHDVDDDDTQVKTNEATIRAMTDSTNPRVSQPKVETPVEIKREEDQNPLDGVPTSEKKEYNTTQDSNIFTPGGVLPPPVNPPAIPPVNPRPINPPAIPPVNPRPDDPPINPQPDNPPDTPLPCMDGYEPVGQLVQTEQNEEFPRQNGVGDRHWQQGSIDIYDNGSTQPAAYVDGLPVPTAQETDAEFLDREEKQSEEEGGEDTLRSQYGMEKAENVIPSEEEQMASDIRFDMFDTVNPGFGNGSDNKLFIMGENRDRKILYAEPTFKPGSYIGPLGNTVVPPWQLQRVMPEEKVRRYGTERRNRLNTISDTVMKYTRSSESTNILGSDMGYPYSHSACELKRNRFSPLEPVIRTDINWEHVKDPIGVQLNKKRFRLETDGQRYPRQLDSMTSGMGGQHLSKRRGLEVIWN